MRRTTRSPHVVLARRLATVSTAAALVATGLGGAPALAGQARAARAGQVAATAVQGGNVVTPGNFTGYGFDQCTAPSQRAMDAWLTSSPYWAAGIYISGDSRGCTSQPNLSATWVRTQLARGWRLLPITLGPQASCTTRERYLHQVRISPAPRRSYARARAQGRAEAVNTVAAATALGIVPGSTLWYDIEGFAISATGCRESALSFLSAWTTKLHRLHYVSGVYSSAASGITMLDDARANRPGRYRMPDQVWIADWNGVASTSSSYVRSSGWTPHRRVHQYRGGHDETYGGVTINIDQNWLDLGTGSTLAPQRAHCGGTASYDYGRYPTRTVGSSGALVKTVQCLLRSKNAYDGPVDGVYDAGLGAAVRAYRVSRGLSARPGTTRRTWVALLSHGPTPLVKYGSAAPAVRRLQRALNAADVAGLKVTGVVDASTTTAIRTYQAHHRLPTTGVAGPSVWRLLLAGRT
jgi:hypothetical protein